jgi:hypothetical protein
MKRSTRVEADGCPEPDSVIQLQLRNQPPITLNATQQQNLAWRYGAGGDKQDAWAALLMRGGRRHLIHSMDLGRRRTHGFRAVRERAFV